MDLARYADKNGVQIRNLLTAETNLEVLAHFVTDARRIVAEKAEARIRALSAIPEAAPVAPVDMPTAPDLTGLETLEGETKPYRASRSAEPHRSKRRRNSAPPVSDALAPVAETRPARTDFPGPDGLARLFDGRGPEPQPPTAKQTANATGTPARIVWTDDSDRKCPKCGEVKKIIPDFGWRAVPAAGGGRKQIPQPWCRKCRNDAKAESRAAQKTDAQKDA